MLICARERLVHQHTERVNALRAIRYECGLVVPQGIGQLERVAAILDAEPSDPPALVGEECPDLLVQIGEKTARVEARAKTAKALAAQANTARRLQTMPGVGPLTALAIEAFAPNMATFQSGRDFAAWLGFVPRQHSAGGKERLGRVSKAGQADIRRLLIIGALSIGALSIGALSMGGPEHSGCDVAVGVARPSDDPPALAACPPAAAPTPDAGGNRLRACLKTSKAGS